MIPVYEPTLGDLEQQYVADCMRSGWISSLGEYVTRFQSEFAAYCGTKHGIATSNGTTALHLALAALGIGPGDEVILPSLTFIASANAVSYTGARAVLADSETRTWGLDPASVEAKITSRTRAIMPVHLYGHPVDMDPILDIARHYNLFVVEDAAEAHGATYKGHRVGGLGTISCFSFYGNKIITTGEGGMCMTNDDALAERLLALRDHGMSSTKRYWHPIVGYNYRLTNLQAAVGVAQLSRIDEIIEKKRQIARWYNERLKEFPGLTLPPELPDCTNVYWMYSVLIEDDFRVARDEVLTRLKAHGIETRPFFYPIHIQPPYALGQSFPVAEELARKGINLPSGPALREEEVELIAHALSQIRCVGVD